MLLLKHVRDWSYEALEREVRAISSFAASAGLGWRKCRPKTLVRLGPGGWSEVITELHGRIVALAQA